jgi:hypothetical protein
MVLIGAFVNAAFDECIIASLPDAQLTGSHHPFDPRIPFPKLRDGLWRDRDTARQVLRTHRSGQQSDRTPHVYEAPCHHRLSIGR